MKSSVTVLKPKENIKATPKKLSNDSNDKSNLTILNPSKPIPEKKKIKEENNKGLEEQQNIFNFTNDNNNSISRYSDTRLAKYKSEPKYSLDDRLNFNNIGPVLFDSFTQSLLQVTGSTKRFLTVKSSSSDINLSLYAYYQQATNGICNIPQPSCLKWLWTSSSNHKRWQAWKNLGDMPKQKAVKRFVETLLTADPNIFTRRSIIIQKLEVESTYRLRELSKNKKIAFFIKYYPIIMKAALTIQSLFRMMKAKKYVYDLRIQRYRKEFKELIKLLISGIKITKLDGKSRLLVLDIDRDYEKAIDNNSNVYEIFNKARIKIINQMSVRGTSKFLFLSDIAEIRSDGNSYSIIKNDTNNDENIKNNYNNFLSIIGLDRTLDFIINIENLPKNKTKNWLIKGLYLLVDLSLSSKTLSLRGYYKGERSFQKPYKINEVTSKDRKNAQLFLRILKKGLAVSDPDVKDDNDHMQLLTKQESKLIVIDFSNTETNNNIVPDSLADKYTSNIRIVLNDKSIDPMDVAEIRVVPHTDDYYDICIIGSEISLQFSYCYNTSKHIDPNNPNHILTDPEFVRLFRAFIKVYKRKFLTKNTINIKKKGSKSSIISSTSTFSRIKL